LEQNSCVKKQQVYKEASSNINKNIPHINMVCKEFHNVLQ
jgi:hypothetical protein